MLLCRRPRNCSCCMKPLGRCFSKPPATEAAPKPARLSGSVSPGAVHDFALFACSLLSSLPGLASQAVPKLGAGPAKVLKRPSAAEASQDSL